MLIYDWTKNGEQVSQSVVNRGAVSQYQPEGPHKGSTLTFWPRGRSWSDRKAF